jgi:hypothetical protein
MIKKSMLDASIGLSSLSADEKEKGDEEAEPDDKRS